MSELAVPAEAYSLAYTIVAVLWAVGAVLGFLAPSKQLRIEGKGMMRSAAISAFLLASFLSADYILTLASHYVGLPDWRSYDKVVTGLRDGAMVLYDAFLGLGISFVVAAAVLGILTAFFPLATIGAHFISQLGFWTVLPLGFLSLALWFMATIGIIMMALSKVSGIFFAAGISMYPVSFTRKLAVTLIVWSLVLYFGPPLIMGLTVQELPKPTPDEQAVEAINKALLLSTHPVKLYVKGKNGDVLPWSVLTYNSSVYANIPANSSYIDRVIPVVRHQNGTVLSLLKFTYTRIYNGTYDPFGPAIDPFGLANDPAVLKYRPPEEIWSDLYAPSELESIWFFGYYLKPDNNSRYYYDLGKPIVEYAIELSEVPNIKDYADYLAALYAKPEVPIENVVPYGLWCLNEFCSAFVHWEKEVFDTPVQKIVQKNHLKSALPEGPSAVYTFIFNATRQSEACWLDRVETRHDPSTNSTYQVRIFKGRAEYGYLTPWNQRLPVSYNKFFDPGTPDSPNGELVGDDVKIVKFDGKRMRYYACLNPLTGLPDSCRRGDPESFYENYFVYWERVGPDYVVYKGLATGYRSPLVIEPAERVGRELDLGNYTRYFDMTYNFPGIIAQHVGHVEGTTHRVAPPEPLVLEPLEINVDALGIRYFATWQKEEEERCPDFPSALSKSVDVKIEAPKAVNYFLGIIPVMDDIRNFAFFPNYSWPDVEKSGFQGRSLMRFFEKDPKWEFGTPPEFVPEEKSDDIGKLAKVSIGLFLAVFGTLLVGDVASSAFGGVSGFGSYAMAAFSSIFKNLLPNRQSFLPKRQVISWPLKAIRESAEKKLAENLKLQALKEQRLDPLGRASARIALHHYEEATSPKVRTKAKLAKYALWTGVPHLLSKLPMARERLGWIKESLEETASKPKTHRRLFEQWASRVLPHDTSAYLAAVQLSSPKKVSGVEAYNRLQELAKKDPETLRNLMYTKTGMRMAISAITGIPVKVPGAVMHGDFKLRGVEKPDPLTPLTRMVSRASSAPVFGIPKPSLPRSDEDRGSVPLPIKEVQVKKSPEGEAERHAEKIGKEIGRELARPTEMKSNVAFVQAKSYEMITPDGKIERIGPDSTPTFHRTEFHARIASKKDLVDHRWEYRNVSTGMTTSDAGEVSQADRRKTEEHRIRLEPHDLDPWVKDMEVESRHKYAAAELQRSFDRVVDALERGEMRADHELLKEASRDHIKMGMNLGKIREHLGTLKDSIENGTSEIAPDIKRELTDTIKEAETKLEQYETARKELLDSRPFLAERSELDREYTLWSGHWWWEVKPVKEKWDEPVRSEPEKAAEIQRGRDDGTEPRSLSDLFPSESRGREKKDLDRWGDA